jgi:hypothetical protein
MQFVQEIQENTQQHKAENQKKKNKATHRRGRGVFHWRRQRVEDTRRHQHHPAVD